MAMISCQSDLLLTDRKQVLKAAIRPGKFLCFHQKVGFYVNVFSFLISSVQALYKAVASHGSVVQQHFDKNHKAFANRKHDF